MDKIIARNIKKLRETARYTQDEVAQALGVTRSAYSNYESGDREVPYDVIEKASDFFGCDMAVLFEENENVDAMILVSAFRLDGMTADDAAEIMRFKDIVLAPSPFDGITPTTRKTAPPLVAFDSLNQSVCDISTQHFSVANRYYMRIIY